MDFCGAFLSAFWQNCGAFGRKLISLTLTTVRSWSQGSWPWSQLLRRQREMEAEQEMFEHFQQRILQENRSNLQDVRRRQKESGALRDFLIFLLFVAILMVFGPILVNVLY